MRETTTKVPTRERILREASRLFADRGFHGTSTRDIAEAVGIRQPSLFHHFANKDAIMLELQRLELEPSLEILDQVSGLDASPAVRLYRYVLLDAERMLDAPYYFTATHVGHVLDDPKFALAREVFDHLMRGQERLIEEGVEAGEFVDVDARLANRVMIWMFDGALADSVSNEMDPTEYAHLLATFSLRSLLVDNSRIDEVRKLAMSAP